MNSRNGSLRMARIAGIDVWVHWSWLLMAVVVIDWRRSAYHSEWWVVAELLGIFGIVLLHEFGHALACRQVGGQANTIMLWPLGGVAYVSPPPRAGAQLWSLVAGPLVNVALIPLFPLIERTLILTDTLMGRGHVEFWTWFSWLEWVNTRLLIFNLLPIFPLDGGQIVRCLLWFGIGPKRSLQWASAVGLLGAAGLAGWSLLHGYLWLVLMAAFLGANSWQAFTTARRVE